MGRNPPTLGFRRHSLTSAKVQNFSRRTSVRPASEDGRGCPRLTDIFLTKWPRCGNKSLYIFNIIWLKNWPKAKQNMKNTPGVWGQSPHEKRGNAGIFFIVADILGHERKLSFMAAAVYGRTFGRNFLRPRPFTAEVPCATLGRGPRTHVRGGIDGFHQCLLVTTEPAGRAPMLCTGRPSTLDGDVLPNVPPRHSWGTTVPYLRRS